MSILPGCLAVREKVTETGFIQHGLNLEYLLSLVLEKRQWNLALY